MLEDSLRNNITSKDGSIKIVAMNVEPSGSLWYLKMLFLDHCIAFFVYARIIFVVNICSRTFWFIYSIALVEVYQSTHKENYLYIAINLRLNISKDSSIIVISNIFTTFTSAVSYLKPSFGAWITLCNISIFAQEPSGSYIPSLPTLPTIHMVTKALVALVHKSGYLVHK